MDRNTSPAISPGNLRIGAWRSVTPSCASRRAMAWSSGSSRTLKEQVIWGRIFRTAAEVHAAVAMFVTRYNAEWRLQRLGYLSPLAYRTQQSQPVRPAA